VSVQRARRQTEREHEAALRTAARASEEERRERRTLHARYSSWRGLNLSPMLLFALLCGLALIAYWLLAAR
jgi:hypothetical protein